MAFELFPKKWGVTTLGHDEVSVSKTSISFGNDFREAFEENDFVEVYLDRSDLKVGFKPSKENSTGYKIRLDDKNGKRAYVSSTKVASLIPIGRYKTNVDINGFITINVTEIIDKDKANDIGIDLLEI